ENPKSTVLPPVGESKAGEFEWRVLVIDDEIAIGELLEVSLTQRGCRVTFLNDPMQLEGAIEKTAFDLVICDLNMPGRNGAQVLRLLRQMQPKLAQHFMLMTGNLGDLDASQTDFESIPALAKPFTLGQLMDALRVAKNRQSETAHLAG
ncbi:MAG: response regulator, partial [Candidatus Acidiferrales bacterium]